MKKLLIPNGGHQFFPNDDLTHLNESVMDLSKVFSELFADVSGGFDKYYLKEAEVSIVGNVYSIDAGAMIFDGEVCLYDAQNVDVTGLINPVVVWEEVVTYRASNPLTYANATQQSPHAIRKVRLAGYISGNEPVGSFTYGQVRTLSFMLGRNLHSTLLGVALNGTWQAIAGYNPLQYQTYQNGRVELYGTLQRGGTVLAANIPADGRPVSTQIIVPVMTYGGGSYVESCTIKANGDVEVSNAGLLSSVCFDGIAYYRY
ncbi:MAG: hypothetical protein M3Q97_02130 [Bacteroidota bacterium]|nr:hypothetical protein [Bacteroidota bacterium]